AGAFHHLGPDKAITKAAVDGLEQHQIGHERRDVDQRVEVPARWWAPIPMLQEPIAMEGLPGVFLSHVHHTARRISGTQVQSLHKKTPNITKHIRSPGLPAPTSAAGPDRI